MRVPRHIIVRGEIDVLWAAEEAGRMAHDAGLDREASVGVMISVSELATNALKYGGGGEVTLSLLEEQSMGIQVVVQDGGPGIPDIESAVKDGWAEGRWMLEGESVGRDGLGSGLGAVKRLMDSLEIANRPEGGCKVVARKWSRTGVH